MKNPESMNAAELAKALDRLRVTPEEFAAAAPPAIPVWRDGTPKSAEAAFDWERNEQDQAFFNRSRADGSYTAALAARTERLAKETAAEARVERDKQLADLLSSNAAKAQREQDREEAKAAEDRLWAENYDRRMRGLGPVDADGKEV